LIAAAVSADVDEVEDCGCGIGGFRRKPPVKVSKGGLWLL